MSISINVDVDLQGQPTKQDIDSAVGIVSDFNAENNSNLPTDPVSGVLWESVEKVVQHDGERALTLRWLKIVYDRIQEVPEPVRQQVLVLLDLD